MILSILMAMIRVPKDSDWNLLIKVFRVGISVTIGICHISWQAQKEINMLCKRDFSVTHGGHNDAKCHFESYGHLKRLSELQPNSNLTTIQLIS